MFAIFDNCLTKKECKIYLNRIESWYGNCITSKKNPMAWESRILNISREPICERIQKFIETKVNVKTSLQSAELQCWPINSYSSPHVHNDEFQPNGRRDLSDYNSLLYLNDNFSGGEFFTETGLTVKPTPGRLTFFDGSIVTHGVNKVLDHHRYTMIFWWKQTKFK